MLSLALGLKCDSHCSFYFQHHRFGWPVVNIHTESDDVPCEYLSTDNEGNNSYGLEFIGLPCGRSHGSCSVSLLFSLPVHLQYHAARAGGGYAFKYLYTPRILFRPSSNVSVQNKGLTDNHSPSKSRGAVNHFFVRSFLNKTGNIAKYHELFGNMSYQPLEDCRSSGPLTFQIPVGNTDHAILTSIGTIVVIIAAMTMMLRAIFSSHSPTNEKLKRE